MMARSTPMKSKLLTQAVLMMLVLLPSSESRCAAQNWIQSSAPVTNWAAVASSADGSKIVTAANGGLIYMSTNSGQDWTATEAPAAPWLSVASSADGGTLIAAAGDSGSSTTAVYISTNSGTAWNLAQISTDTFINWRAVACSADGRVWVAGSAVVAGEAYDSQVFVSTNRGSTWTGNILSLYLNSLAASADGSELVAASMLLMNFGGVIYTSTNWGATWPISGAPSNPWRSVAASADGTKLAAVVNYGSVYSSSDSGATWVQTSAPSGQWTSVATSADGTKLVVVANTGPIYTSTDSGVSWTSNNAPITNWSAVASSADGSKLVAVVNGGGIYRWQSRAVVPGTVLWTYDVGSTIDSSPAIGKDGTLFVAATDGLHAITNSGSNGSNKWVFNFSGGQSGSPAVAADGTVYIANNAYPGYLYAVNPDGSQKWKYLTQGGNGSPAIGWDNTIYIHGYNALHAVAPEGSMKWRTVIGGQYIFGSPTIGFDGTIYITSSDAGSFSALHPDGTLKWSVYAGLGFGEAPALGNDGTVYLSESGVFAYSPSGANLWSHPAALYTSPAVGRDGTIYISDWQSFGLTYGLDLEAFAPSGTLEWEFRTNLDGGVFGFAGTPAIDTAGVIYLTAWDRLFALAHGGNVQWSFRPQDGSTSQTSPTIGEDGTIYACFGTKLWAIAGTNGPADAPWPMYHQNPRHTSKVEKPFFDRPRTQAQNGFAFSFYGQLGQSYIVQTSTNLTTWTALTNFSVVTVPMDVVDSTARNASTRFYRAVSLP